MDGYDNRLCGVDPPPRLDLSEAQMKAGITPGPAKVRPKGADGRAPGVDCSVSEIMDDGSVVVEYPDGK